MGYVLGFFVGDHRADDDVNRRRWEELPGTAAAPPVSAVVDFVGDATRRWPDSEDFDDDSPWGDAPLLDNASGQLVLVNIVIDQIPSVFPELLQMAWNHGLVCFDPATDRVIDSL